MASPRRRYRRDVAWLDDSKRREMRSNRIGHVGWRQVGIVALCHTGVRMPELAGNDGEGDASHRQGAAMGVPQYVKTDGRLDATVFAGGS